MTNFDSIIENISENSLKDIILGQLEELNKDMVEDDFEFFIDYLKEDDLPTLCICDLSYEKAKSLLIKMINCFNIKNINADETLKLIRENGTRVITRYSDWNLSEIPVLNDSALDINIKCLDAQFKDISKWGYESPHSSVHEIIYNDNKILWITHGFTKPQYFILKNENIYGISYEHKGITIYNNLDITFKEFIINSTGTNFDDIIKKCDQMEFDIHEIEIDLSEYFYKGFFYRGLLWDRNWAQEISVLKSIGFNNGLLKIEIENLTYPHISYILLDIESAKVCDVSNGTFNVKIRNQNSGKHTGG